MSAFAVVERELQIAARSWLTPWLRVLVASLGLLFAWSILSWSSVGPGAAGAGRLLFQTLSWFAFAFCLIEGIRRTYDSVSAERREGLLELLLLTPLKGYQLILGKMAAASVGSAFAFLAALPVMAIAFSAGGVTFGEFWRTQLALANTLFLSMCCGLFVSARSSDGQRSLAGAIALLVAVAALPFALDGLFLGRFLIPCSPVMGVMLADDAVYQTHADDFWRAMIELQAVGWTLILLAGERARRLSGRGEAVAALPMPSPEEHLAWKYSPAPSLHAKPRAPETRLIEANPVAWMLRRSGPGGLLIWMAMGFLVAGQLGVLGPWIGFRGPGGLYTAYLIIQMLLPALMIAVAVSRSITDARQNGTLEALLCVPLSGREIAEGFWNGAWKRIRLPFVLLVIILFAPVVARSFAPFGEGLKWENIGWGIVRTAPAVLEILAVTSLALWLAARTARPAYAVGLSLVWVVIVPWVTMQLFWLGMRSFAPVTRPGSLVWGMWSWRIASIMICAYLLWLFLKSRRLFLDRFREAISEATVGQRQFLWWR